MYGFLADVMVAIHVSYVAYVVLGQLFIWFGLIMGWRCVRNMWFRITHMLAIGIVVFEELMDIRCPLSVWEERLRELAGQPTTGETFLGRMMHSLIFYDFQPWVFTAIYLTCGSVILLTFILYPPRRQPKAVQAT
jgi:hypothetical protein